MALAVDGRENNQPPTCQENMVLLAQSIRERSTAIQRHVNLATDQVQIESSGLKRQGDAVGFTERGIKIDQKRNPTSASGSVVGDLTCHLCNLKGDFSDAAACEERLIASSAGAGGNPVRWHVVIRACALIQIGLERLLAPNVGAKTA